MDTFAHNDPNDQGEQREFTYRGAGAGRKESPYADSPYVMHHTRQEPSEPVRPKPRPQPPKDAGEPKQEASGTRPPKQKRKSGGKFWKRAIAAMLTLALVAGGCLITADAVNRKWERRTDALARQIQDLQKQLDSIELQKEQPVIGNPVSETGTLTPGQVYARNVNSVVIVYSQVSYYAYGKETSGTSTGSGFIISEDGYVLTNYHVIEGAKSVTVVTHGGDQLSAAIIGSDAANDVALLKVEGKGMPAVTLGSSEELSVGDQVAAIGNPLGELTSTMTVGYISGKERAVTSDNTTIHMIQTDAAINSGNSGGPLFNMKGEVIGITTAKYSGQSSSGASIEGIGFAIPIDDVMDVIGDLLEFGYVKTAYMGITVVNMDPSVAATYNLPVGVYIQSVEADGPAAKAGLQAEDIIIELDGTAIENHSDLSRVLRNREPGDAVGVTVFRGGKKLNLTIVLGEKPVEQGTAGDNAQEDSDSRMPSEGSYEDWYEYFKPFFGQGGDD